MDTALSCHSLSINDEWLFINSLFSSESELDIK